MQQSVTTNPASNDKEPLGKMSSLKDVRQLLVLSHDSNVVFGQEFKGGRGGSHSSEFGQNCDYFQSVFVSTSELNVRPPSDHLSQIRLTDQKDQTSRSVWVWLTNFANFANFAKIAFKQTNAISQWHFATNPINNTRSLVIYEPQWRQKLAGNTFLKIAQSGHGLDHRYSVDGRSG